MAFKDKTDITKLFIGKALRDIKFFNVNDNYFEFETESILTIDGCVEMYLDNEIISIGWDAENEFVNTIQGNAEKLLGNLSYFEINDEFSDKIKSAVDHKIKSVDTLFDFVSYTNDEFETTGEKEYFIKEIILEFENQDKIQIAPIDFEVDIKNKKLINPTYNSMRDILISFNNVIEIAEPTEDEDFL